MKPRPEDSVTATRVASMKPPRLKYSVAKGRTRKLAELSGSVEPSRVR